ncbi:hypothetical protein SLE2022_071550 [Rubroshorea leprosula]
MQGGAVLWRDRRDNYKQIVPRTCSLSQHLVGVHFFRLLHLHHTLTSPSAFFATGDTRTGNSSTENIFVVLTWKIQLWLCRIRVLTV